MYVSSAPPPLALRPKAVHNLLISEASNHTKRAPHSVGLIWTSDQPVAETSTRQHSILTSRSAAMSSKLCTILYYTTLYYSILYYTKLYCTILHYAILYYTTLYCTILYYTILRYTILYYTILYYTILYYTVLYCTVLYSTVL